jgi:hypothetical protein
VTTTPRTPAPRTLTPITLGRFFRLIGGVVAATVGLLFLVVGINLLGSQQWASTTGTVQSCKLSVTGTGTSKQTHQTCTIAWQEDGKAHSHQVDFGTKPVYNGQTKEIKVSGDNAVLPSPLWVAVLTFVVGIALIAGCVYLVIRSRRGTPAKTP